MKYTRHDSFKKHNNPVNWEKGCEHCKKPFGEDEEFVRLDIQTNWFRGDDEVFCFHKNCVESGIIELNKQITP